MTHERAVRNSLQSFLTANQQRSYMTPTKPHTHGLPNIFRYLSTERIGRIQELPATFKPVPVDSTVHMHPPISIVLYQLNSEQAQTSYTHLLAETARLHARYLKECKYGLLESRFGVIRHALFTFTLIYHRFVQQPSPPTRTTKPHPRRISRNAICAHTTTKSIKARLVSPFLNSICKV